MYDQMEVYDGPTKEFPLIGKFCGQKKPADIVSTTSQVLIVFKGVWPSIVKNSVENRNFIEKKEAKDLFP